MRLTAAFRAHEVRSRLADQPRWAQRGRTPAEAARIGPLALAVRALKTAIEARAAEGRPFGWGAGGSYRPGGPTGVFVSEDGWLSEHVLPWRDGAGIWRIDDELCWLFEVGLVTDMASMAWLHGAHLRGLGSRTIPPSQTTGGAAFRPQEECGGSAGRSPHLSLTALGRARVVFDEHLQNQVSIMFAHSSVHIVYAWGGVSCVDIDWPAPSQSGRLQTGRGCFGARCLILIPARPVFAQEARARQQQ